MKKSKSALSVRVGRANEIETVTGVGKAKPGERNREQFRQMG